MYLHDNICQDDQDWIRKVEQQPDLYWFDVGCAGQGGGDGHVDGGEHHHARDVHRDDQVMLGVPGDVVDGLVDDVHQERGEICDHNDVEGVLCQGD